MAPELSCKRTRKLLALLPGSDLPPELDQPVRDHLASCPACQRRLGDHLRVRSALGRLAPSGRAGHRAGHRAQGREQVFFADLKQDILDRLAEDRARRQAEAARVSGRRLTLARWMTAAALMLLAVYLIPQMLAEPPDLPDGHPSGTASSVRDPRYLPAVGLQGQEEILRDVLVLDGGSGGIEVRLPAGLGAGPGDEGPGDEGPGDRARTGSSR